MLRWLVQTPQSNSVWKRPSAKRAEIFTSTRSRSLIREELSRTPCRHGSLLVSQTALSLFISATVANTPGAFATVAEMNSDNAVWLTRSDPCRHGVRESSSLMSDLDRVDVNISALFADGLFQTELLCGVWTNQRSIVPG